jgi:DNA-binding LytR/AlgR family response regulator
MQRAIEKFRKWSRQDVMLYLSQLSHLSPANRYKDKILIPFKDKLIPVDVREISCFYSTEKNTGIYLKKRQ